MESYYLIISSSALVAITLAIFVFFLPKTVEIHNTRWKSMQSLDMPDSIRNSKLFRIATFSDNIGMFVVAFVCLLLAGYFTSILINAISGYFGLQGTFLFDQPVHVEFIRALKILWFILVFVLIVSILWLSAGSQISKTLPIITRAYVEMTLDVSREPGMKQDLVSAATSFLLQGAYSKAILHSVTSLEYGLRKKLNLGPNNSFAAVMSKLVNSDLAWVIPREINDLVIMRNNIAHKKDAVNYGEEEAKEIIESVNRILEQLDVLGASTLYK